MISRFAQDLHAMYLRMCVRDTRTRPTRKTTPAPATHPLDHQVRHLPQCRQCMERKLDAAQHIIDCFDLNCEVLACRCIQDGRLVDEAVPEFPPGVLFELFLRKRGTPTEQSTAHLLVSLPELSSRTSKVPLAAATFEVPSTESFFDEHETLGVHVLAWHLAHTPTAALTEVQMRLSRIRALIAMTSVPEAVRKWHVRVKNAYRMAQILRNHGIVPRKDLHDSVSIDNHGEPYDYPLFSLPPLTEERKMWAATWVPVSEPATAMMPELPSAPVPSPTQSPTHSPAPVADAESRLLQLARVAESFPPCDEMTRKRGRGASQSNSA